MSDVVIEIEGLSKRYRIGEDASYGRLTESLSNLFSPKRRRLATRDDHIWALNEVSLQVQRGQALGVIGHNGAGKTTLLKLLSRITEPTAGRAVLYGRVGSLLEVGTGFHPELSGRDNIFLNGAILGMRKAEISAQFDQIVDFAEMARFIDTPVKRYSSGMYVRLAFAVAAHLDTEILIVDEVLAVGDASFQKKCLGKMQTVADQGRTVLFVSHNMQAISTLTDQSILLDRGRSIAYGPTSEVVDRYQRELETAPSSYRGSGSGDQPSVKEVDVRTSRPGNVHVVGEPIEFMFTLDVPTPTSGTALSFQIHNAWGQPVVHLQVLESEMSLGHQSGVFKVICRVPKLRLYIGRYALSVHFADRTGKLETIEGICPFEVVSLELREHYWVPGTAAYVEDCSWEVEQISAVAVGRTSPDGETGS